MSSLRRLCSCKFTLLYSTVVIQSAAHCCAKNTTNDFYAVYAWTGFRIVLFRATRFAHFCLVHEFGVWQR